VLYAIKINTGIVITATIFLGQEIMLIYFFSDTCELISCSLFILHLTTWAYVKPLCVRIYHLLLDSFSLVLTHSVCTTLNRSLINLYVAVTYCINRKIVK